MVLGKIYVSLNPVGSIYIYIAVVVVGGHRQGRKGSKWQKKKKEERILR